MRPFRNDINRGLNYPSNDPPLLDNQLQDLDLELEILKRQREIIKQKQLETQRFSQRQNIFNQPSSSFGRPEPKQPYYANNYDNYDNYDSSNKNVQKGYKRPSDRNWQTQSAPKQSRQYENHYKPSNPPQPLMKMQTPQYRNVREKNYPKFNPKPRTDFKPTKVVKPKNFIDNKTKTSNIPQQAKKMLSEPKPKKVFGPNEILRRYEEPTPSMKGRLELALGDITKAVKQSPSLDKELLERFTSGSVQRQVKNIIRQRITEVMLDKIVGPATDIIAQYRKKYPNAIDEEILKTIKTTPVQVAKHIVVKPITAAESGDIRTFFKTKITQLLEDKMKEMVDNLGKIYGDNEEEILKCLNDLPDIEEIDNEKKDSEENKDKKEENGSETEKNNAEVEDSQNSAETNKENAEENKKDAKDDIADNKDTVDENTNANSSNSVETSNLNQQENTENKETDKKGNVPEKINKIDQYYKLMDILIVNRLPKLLFRFRDNFARVMYCEKDFIVAKEMIMMETKEKLRMAFKAANSNNSDGTSKNETYETPVVKAEVDESEKAGNIKQETKTIDNKEKSVAATTDKPQKTPQKGGQLYVMLLGRPSLPSKPVIYEFLNKFHPLSIKKHKSVNNLLVIGFDNKEDYDNILAANESKVGDATFIIKANEVIASEKQNTGEQDTSTSDAGVAEKQQNGEVVNEEITDNNEKIVDNAMETENSNMETIEEADENDVQILNDDVQQNDDLQILNDDAQQNDDVQIVEEKTETPEVKDDEKNLKDSVATPTRSSSRLANATPSTIRTRRASRLAQ